MFALLLLPVIAPMGSPLQAPSRSMESYVQGDLRDFTLNLIVESKRLPELRKIGPEFAQTYLFDSILVRGKEPFQLRFDASADDTKATYVMNGATQSFKVPRLGLNQHQDLSKYPGRRQTLFEFALLTPSLFSQFYEATFVRFDRESGNPIFDLRFPAATKDTSRNRIWVDKSRHFIVRREWYGQEDQLKATFTYEKPIEVSRVWFPTRLTVRNAEDKVGAVVRYINVKANTGLNESLFKL